MLALVLLIAAATSPCDADLNQMQLDVCWSNRADAADKDLKAEFAKTAAGLRALGIDPAPLAAAQHDWEKAADKTCDFESALYESGSIAPMIYSECQDRMTRARTARLAALLAARQRGAKPAESPASQSARQDLDRFYALLAKQDLTKTASGALAQAQSAWVEYRNAACEVEGGACLSELDEERIGDLKAGWIGEAFW